jgi:cytochrome c-type biogenesis protein CcmH
MSADVAVTSTTGQTRARSLVTRHRGPRWLGPLLLLAVLGVALLIGSGALESAPATPSQRAHALETQIRCPSCVDVSVADSSAATAVSLRQQILDWERQGWSDQEIKNALVARYGLSILLEPPTSGLTAVVWIVPAVGGAAAIAVVGTVFWRRSRDLRALQRATADAENEAGDGAGTPSAGEAVR